MRDSCDQKLNYAHLINKQFMPKVSVIIPTFNYGSYISEAIDSALNQNYHPMEIIVIDDGSTDCTQAIIQNNYKGKLTYFFQKNKGAPIARNRGIAASHGQYLVFLDADDELGHDQISHYVRCLENNPDSVIYGPSIRYIQDHGIRKELYTMQKFQGADMLDGWLRGWYIAPCCILWPKDVLVALGGWDETLLANQDGDLAMRALINGHTFSYRSCPPAFIRHHSTEIQSISSDHSHAALYSRLHVLNQIERLLSQKHLLQKYLIALSEAYYYLGLYHIKANADFARECYRHFRRLRGFGRPPGSILNWLLISLIGIVNKDRLSDWHHKTISR